MSTKTMNEDLFDYIVAHALADVQNDEMQQAVAEFGDVQPSKRFADFFKKMIAKRKRQRLIRSTPRYLKRTIISFCAVLSALSLALFTQGPVQAAVKAVFYEWTQTHVGYSTGNGAANETASPYYGIKLGWVPEGYSLLESNIKPFSRSQVTYIDTTSEAEAPATITLYCAPVEQSATENIDNEHGTNVPLQLDGCSDVLFIQSDSPEYNSHVIWSKDNYLFRLRVPYGTSEETIKNLATGVQFFS